MKRLLLLVSIFSCWINTQIISQTASVITVSDTRAENPLPGAFYREVRFDFKARDIVGVPGAGYYSGMLTFAPWGDYTGNKVHQLNFNDGGLFWRTGSQGNSWENWRSLVLTDPNGNVGIGTNNPLGKFEIKGPYTGNSQLIINSTASNAELRFSSNDVPKGFVWYNFGNDCMAFGRGSITNSLFVNSGGNFGIGTTNPQNKLDVNGTIHAREVKVDLTGWSDFVFHPSYQLKPLIEVEKFIKTNGHLEDIPSAAEVEQNGVNVGEMQKLLLQKVEELTLYVIELKKENEQLKLENTQGLEDLKIEIEKLKNK
jgi:hypothetical protein